MMPANKCYSRFKAHISVALCFFLIFQLLRVSFRVTNPVAEFEYNTEYKLSPASAALHPFIPVAPFETNTQNRIGEESSEDERSNDYAFSFSTALIFLSPSSVSDSPFLFNKFPLNKHLPFYILFHSWKHFLL